MKFFIILFLILVIFTVFLFKLKTYIQKKNESIGFFLERVNKFIRINNINIDCEYVFNRFIKYKNKKVSLGKVIFDNQKELVLIYETFIYKSNKLVCIPDIRIFSYKSLINCSIFENTKKINCLKNDTFKKNSSIFMKLQIKNDLNDYIILRFSSVNDNKTFINIYNEFNKIIDNNKK